MKANCTQSSKFKKIVKSARNNFRKPQWFS